MAAQAVGAQVGAHAEAVGDHGRHGWHRHIGVCRRDQYVHLPSREKAQSETLVHSERFLHAVVTTQALRL